MKFEYHLDRWIENRVNDEHQRQQHRLELRTGFLPLTHAIQAAHTELKPYHFSNECDMINRFIVCDAESFFNSKTGSKAREWRLTWMPFDYKNPTHNWEKWEAENKATVSK